MNAITLIFLTLLVVMTLGVIGWLFWIDVDMQDNQARDFGEDGGPEDLNS